MDSLQVAVSAYVTEHGSIDVDMYLRLADIYIEAGDEEKTKIFQKFGNNHDRHDKAVSNDNDAKKKTIRVHLSKAAPILKKIISALRSIYNTIKSSDLDNPDEVMEDVVDALGEIRGYDRYIHGFLKNYHANDHVCIREIKSALDLVSPVLKNSTTMGIISADLKNELKSASESLQKIYDDIIHA